MTFAARNPLDNPPLEVKQLMEANERLTENLKQSRKTRESHRLEIVRLKKVLSISNDSVVQLLAENKKMKAYITNQLGDDDGHDWDQYDAIGQSNNTSKGDVFKCSCENGLVSFVEDAPYRAAGIRITSIPCPKCSLTK